MKFNFQKRIKKLQNLLEKKNLYSFLITNPYDILYYTGFYAEGSFLIINTEPVLFTNTLYNEAQNLKTVKVLFINDLKTITNFLKGFVGFDEFDLNSHIFLKFKKLGVKLKPAGEIIKEPRRIKEEKEIELIKKSVKTTKKILENLNFYGKTEEKLASEIESSFFQELAKPAFDPIVSSGPNTKFVHYKPGKRIIKKNDLILIDLGARFNWYCSDITRMILNKNKKIKEKFEELLELQRKIINKIKPGIKFEELEKIYTEFLKANKCEKFHSLGHSIGLEEHERIGNELKENMIITIEPGIYLKNFGLRIEDMVLVKKKKAKVLSEFIPLLL